MNTNRTHIRNISTAALALFFLQGCGQASTTPKLPQIGQAAEGATIFNVADGSHLNNDVQALTESFITVSIPAFKAAASRAFAKQSTTGAGHELERVTLQISSNEAISFSIQDVMYYSADNIVLTGKIADDDDSVITLVTKDGILTGHINRGQGELPIEIRHEQAGIHSVRTLPSPNQVIESEPVHAPEALTPDGANVETLAPLATPVIDILVAYSPTARYRQGGKSAMEAKIQEGIADANAAYRDSGINLQVRLVGMMETQQDERYDHNSDLASLAAPNDGRFDEVIRERDRIGADQVTFVGSYATNPNAAGVGYFSARGVGSMFTVVAVKMFPYYTLAHELGHNLGLDHPDGYINYQARFRTIMAYNPPGYNFVRIRRFSNPSLYYGRWLTGDSWHNSAAILNRNAARASTFNSLKITAP